MKKLSVLSVVLLLAAFCGYGQGTSFLYDQQSSTDEAPPPPGSGWNSLWDVSSGQSFTPALAGVDFVRFMFHDANPNDGLGVAVYVTLRSGAINGNIIGTTAAATMPEGFAGPTMFLFPNHVPVAPGVAYYFNAVPQSGGPFQIFGTTAYNYPGGTAFGGAFPDPAADLWFREGIIVPEPSSTALLLLAGTAAWLLRRKTG